MSWTAYIPSPTRFFPFNPTNLPGACWALLKGQLKFPGHYDHAIRPFGYQLRFAKNLHKTPKQRPVSACILTALVYSNTHLAGRCRTPLNRPLRLTRHLPAVVDVGAA